MCKCTCAVFRRGEVSGGGGKFAGDRSTCATLQTVVREAKVKGE